MTCIPNGTLIEVLRPSGVVELCKVENVCVGDELCGEYTMNVYVDEILKQETGGLWPTYSYMGLRADPTQWVRLPTGEWERISDMGTFSIAPVHTLYGIVIRGGKTIRAGGVQCCAHNYSDVHYSPSSPPSSLLSSTATTFSN